MTWYTSPILHRFVGHWRDKWDGECYRCACGYIWPKANA